MKLIRIDHWRCNEPSAYTFVLCPEEWSNEEIQSRLYNAQKTYLKTIEEAKKASEHGKVIYQGDYTNLIKIGKKNPDKSFAEVINIWEKKKKEWSEWKQKQEKLAKRFENFLTFEGFVSLYDDDMDNDFTLDWAHRHGERLNYEDTKTDTMPRAVDFEDWVERES